eukprot:6181809-Pleurochrysis_carterae.AAC.6
MAADAFPSLPSLLLPLLLGHATAMQDGSAAAYAEAEAAAAVLPNATLYLNLLTEANARTGAACLVRLPHSMLSHATLVGNMGCFSFYNCTGHQLCAMLALAPLRRMAALALTTCAKGWGAESASGIFTTWAAVGVNPLTTVIDAPSSKPELQSTTDQPTLWVLAISRRCQAKIL